MEQLFTENFAALELGCKSAWPKSADSRVGKFVNKSVDQRRFRANNNKVDFMLFHGIEKCITVSGLNRQVRRFFCGPSISRGGKDICSVACQFPYEGMFSPSIAYNKYCLLYTSDAADE